ncbi:MAG: DUF6421 family protein [Nocardioides sp.]
MAKIASGTSAAATLSARGYRISWIDFAAWADTFTSDVDAIVVDIATPLLPDAVWRWIESGGGLLCVGQPSAAIAGRLGEITGRTWEPGAHDALATLTPPVTDRVASLDLVAGVDSLKAVPSYWRPVDGATPGIGRTPGELPPAEIALVVGGAADRPAVMSVPDAAGRVVLLADSGLVSDLALQDPSARALWLNAVGAASLGPGVSVRKVDDSEIARHPAWSELKEAVEQFRPLQAKDGSLAPVSDGASDRGATKRKARLLIRRIVAALSELSPHFEHDAPYLARLQADLEAWSKAGLGVPDFLESLVEFRPELSRRDKTEHLVLFPMYTQNGNPNRNLEAVLLRVVWPDFVAELEETYGNPQFVPVEFIDFTAGYDTASAVLFPETVAVREAPKFTWGAIFCDREAARFRKVIGAAVDTMRLPMPPDAARLLRDQALAQETFVIWDLIHDRAHSRGDLPFDPFMIKQRMPFWLYALEELRCDLTAYRVAVELEGRGVPHARLVQYAVFFDRTFRFPITGSRQRNYDGLGGQLLFAYLHRTGVVNWTDNRLTVDWVRLPGAMIGLLAMIEDLYWRSIDRPKVSHWLAAYELVTGYVEPHPASTWAQGKAALPLTAELKELTTMVMPDEFPLSMFFEALSKRVGSVVESTRGITGRAA